MTHSKITYAAQGIASMILVGASVMKFMGDSGSVEIFSSLGMEPTGRYVIAVIEMAAALLLLSPLAAAGSVLVVGVMCGAVIAHISQLGLSVNGDGGMAVVMLFVVLTCAGYVMVARRREIPIVGGTL
ncbi:MAG: DoxX family protein [Planctomycetes bacterium]|nr:DoxX family protein [Planctomycetota bacterium]